MQGNEGLSTRSAASAPPVDVVAARMGYGHLRPAHALARAAGVPVIEADRSPVASPFDRLFWAGSRWLYEGTSRLSGKPVVGTPAQAVLGALTRIPPLDAPGDLSRPDPGSRALSTVLRLGFGRRLARWLGRRDTSLVATFYAPAHAAATHGHPSVFLVVTDTDVARVWVESEPARGSIVYCVPTQCTRSRLLRYGVPGRRIRVTGFPLPEPLTEEQAARSNFENRCRRLEGGGEPVHLALSIGGAGAQAGIALDVAEAILPMVSAGRLRITLVAGIHGDVSRRFEAALCRWRDQGRLPPRGMEVLFAPRHGRLFEKFDRLLAGVDLLWTKPSELVFFAALGLPLILAPAVGAQEQANRRWLLGAGCAVDQPPVDRLPHWLSASLEAGTLAGLARRGFAGLPRNGVARILAEVAMRRAPGNQPTETSPGPGPHAALRE